MIETSSCLDKTCDFDMKTIVNVNSTGFSLASIGSRGPILRLARSLTILARDPFDKLSNLPEPNIRNRAFFERTENGSLQL